MRLHKSNLLLGLLWTSSTLGSAEATTCKTLADPSSTILRSVASMAQIDSSIIPVDSFSEFDEAFPWMSKCFGAIDPNAVLLSLESSTKDCLATINEFELDLSTSDGWSNACGLVGDTVIPCIQSAMKESIMDAFDSTNTCCDDFLAKVKSLFGDSLDDMVNKLVQLANKVACSKRTFKSLKGASTTEVCGYSIVQSFSSIELDDNDGSGFLNLFMIPNNQMCKAFEGKSFTTTEGDTATIGFGSNDVDTMGICLQPIDSLVQYMASWPIFSLILDANGTAITLANLFAQGKSLQGELIISYMSTPTNLPMIAFRTINDLLYKLGGDYSSGYSEVSDPSSTDGSALSGSVGGSYSWDNSDSSTAIVDAFQGFVDSMNPFATDLSLHIPNNGGCTYADQSISDPSPGSSSGSTTSTTTTTSSASAINVDIVMAVGVALLFSLVALH